MGDSVRDDKKRRSCLLSLLAMQVRGNRGGEEGAEGTTTRLLSLEC